MRVTKRIGVSPAAPNTIGISVECGLCYTCLHDVSRHALELLRLDGNPVQQVAPINLRRERIEEAGQKEEDIRYMKGLFPKGTDLCVAQKVDTLFGGAHREGFVLPADTAKNAS